MVLSGPEPNRRVGLGVEFLPSQREADRVSELCRSHATGVHLFYYIVPLAKPSP